MYREEGVEGTTRFVFLWIINRWFGKNKTKQRMVIRVSTPRGKDLCAASKFMLRKPILAEECYTEIVEGISTTSTK